jgi:agmatine/peptidylarginine deiminase
MLHSIVGGNLTPSELLDHVRFIYVPSDFAAGANTIPHPVITEDGDWALSNPPWNPPWLPPLPNDLAFPQNMSEHLGVPVYETPDDLYISGGNLHTDGAGTMFLLESVYRLNPGLTPEMLEDLMQTFYGMDRVIVLPSVAGELIGDVDVVLMPLDENTLAVAQAPAWSAKYHDDLEAIATILENTNSHNDTGAPYTVVRIPVPNGSMTDLLGLNQFSYANSIIVNQTIIVPMYGDLLHPFAALQDLNTLQAFKSYKPDHDVVGVPYRAFVDRGIRCTTSSIPQDFIDEFIL